MCMRTENGVRQYWEASMRWRGRIEDAVTTEHLFDALRPLEIHRSTQLAKQATELSDMIVKWKKSRCPKPRRKLTNLVMLPISQLQKTQAA